MSGDENHNPNPSAQQQPPAEAPHLSSDESAALNSSSEPGPYDMGAAGPAGQEVPTNPQQEVFGAMAAPPNVADFLSPEQMQAFEQVSMEYGDGSDSAALSSNEPVLHDMGMAPPPPTTPPVAAPQGVTQPQDPEAALGTPPGAPPPQGVTEPLGQAVVPHQPPGSEGMPSGDTHGTPVAPPPEPVEHDPGLEAPLRMTPPRTAFRDTVQDDPTGVTDRSSITPPGSETIDLISANNPGEAVPLWTGAEPPGTPSQGAPPPPDFEPVPPPQPAAPAPTDPTHVDQSDTAPEPPPPDPIFLTNPPPEPLHAADEQMVSSATRYAAEAASHAATAKAAAEVDLDAGDEAIRAIAAAERAAQAADKAAAHLAKYSDPSAGGDLMDHFIIQAQTDVALHELIQAQDEASDAIDEAAW